MQKALGIISYETFAPRFKKNEKRICSFQYEDQKRFTQYFMAPRGAAESKDELCQPKVITVSDNTTTNP